jgi:integrase
MNNDDLIVHLEAYLDYRKSLGYKQEQRGLLSRFVNDHTRDHPGEPIKVDRLLDWITSDQRTAQTRVRRLSALRGFLRFLNGIDAETPIPDSHLLQCPARKPPFIWNAEQLQDLVKAARAVRPVRGLRPQAYVSVIGLLASSGLRISEALRLQVKDVHLKDPIPHLVIRETKFKKSRIVPLHQTVARRLSDYVERRSHHCRARHPATFFVTDSAHSLDLKYMQGWFSRTTDRLGLRTPGGRRPTLHSLRHTFAVSRLTQWYAEQRAVLDLVPNLSVYLGHASLADSYWYISATPELLSGAGSLFENYSTQGAIK